MLNSEPSAKGIINLGYYFYGESSNGSLDECR